MALAHSSEGRVQPLYSSVPGDIASDLSFSLDYAVFDKPPIAHR